MRHSQQQMWLNPAVGTMDKVNTSAAPAPRGPECEQKSPSQTHLNSEQRQQVTSCSLGTWHAPTNVILTAVQGVTVTMPILWVRKLRHRDVKWLV